MGKKRGGRGVWKGSDWGRSGGGKIIIIIIIIKGSFGEKGEKGVENGDGYQSWGGRYGEEREQKEEGK